MCIKTHSTVWYMRVIYGMVCMVCMYVCMYVCVSQTQNTVFVVPRGENSGYYLWSLRSREGGDNICLSQACAWNTIQTLSLLPKYWLLSWGSHPLTIIPCGAADQNVWTDKIWDTLTWPVKPGSTAGCTQAETHKSKPMTNTVKRHSCSHSALDINSPTPSPSFTP